jgi:hypothetical protein
VRSVLPERRERRDHEGRRRAPELERVEPERGERAGCAVLDHQIRGQRERPQLPRFDCDPPLAGQQERFLVGRERAVRSLAAHDLGAVAGESARGEGRG